MSKLFKEVAKTGDRISRRDPTLRWTQVRVVFNTDEDDPGKIQALYVPAALVDRFVALLEPELEAKEDGAQLNVPTSDTHMDGK